MGAKESMREVSQIRCTCCGVLYGYDPIESGQSGRWCQKCHKVVQDALAKVTKRFEGRYLDIRKVSQFSKVTPDMVLRWAFQNHRTVWPGYVDSKTGAVVKQILGAGDFEWHRFRLTQSKEENHIEVLMEYDLIEGRFTDRPWTSEK